MPKYVLSTATCSQRFVDYHLGANGGVHSVLKEVLIKGGANSPSSTSGFGDLANTEGGQPLWTPQGCVTTITDEEAKFLESHEGFQAAVKRGFYTVMDKNPGDSHSKLAKIVESDMTKKDGSAPLNKETLKGAVKVTTKLKVDDEE